jgi:hypothetical protein
MGGKEQICVEGEGGRQAKFSAIAYADAAQLEEKSLQKREGKGRNRAGDPTEPRKEKGETEGNRSDEGQKGPRQERHELEASKARIGNEPGVTRRGAKEVSVELGGDALRG